MSVYVDDFDVVGMRVGRMIMCHMIADSSDELLEMADKIGVQRKWIQDYGTQREHFDICKSKKKLAIKHGAIELPMRELAKMALNRTDYK